MDAYLRGSEFKAKQARGIEEAADRETVRGRAATLFEQRQTQFEQEQTDRGQDQRREGAQFLNKAARYMKTLNPEQWPAALAEIEPHLKTYNMEALSIDEFSIEAFDQVIARTQMFFDEDTGPEFTNVLDADGNILYQVGRDGKAINHPLTPKDRLLNPEELEQAMALRTAGKTTITNTVDMGRNAPDLPSGMMWETPNDPASSNYAVTKIPGSEKPLSGEGAKSLEIAQGGTEAVDDMLARIANGDFSALTVFEAAFVPSFLASENAQQFEILQSDLADMLGRLRSGGAINEDELVTFMGLIPKWHNSEKTKKWKLKRLGDKFSRLSDSLTAGKGGDKKPTDKSQTIEEMAKELGYTLPDMSP